MTWEEFDAYIFDVDGTLYSQKRLRISMMFRLLAHYAIRPHRLKEIIILHCFRNCREKKEYKDKTIDELCSTLEERFNESYDTIYRIIKKWMFIVPLDLVKKYKYKDVISFINQQYVSRKTIVIYSDYPAIDKLEAIGINYNKVFVSGENGIVEQKPSWSAMNTLLSEISIPVNKLCYIGDRDDKDRASAEMIKVKYYDIREFLKIIR